MVFSSVTFLFIFLPVTVLVYFALPDFLKNYLLLFVSLLFYSWGEPKYILLMLCSITLNFFLGLAIAKANTGKAKPILLAIAVSTNLALLGYFKYFGFFTSIINSITSSAIIPAKEILLPIGISFYTFQAMSYIIDLYKGEIEVQKNYSKLALYISFFPQLIAGPIVQYIDIAKQLDSRAITHNDTAYGIKRFIFGLSKKVIFANTFGQIADRIFGIQPSLLSADILVFGAICYTIQIYYDFSGYSDMAIGLGRIFGFRFLENFNYPYLSSSVQEFWQRWHISLSGWFKRYLYIPLGGNQKGFTATITNLFIVFFATGLWHGASLQFIVWGLWHGLFLVIERLFLKKLLIANKYKIINRIYTLSVVVVGWILFRASGLKLGLQAIFNIVKANKGSVAFELAQFLNFRTAFLFILAVLFCGVIQSIAPQLKADLYCDEKQPVYMVAILGSLLFISVMLLTAGTYNPFIYFRF